MHPVKLFCHIGTPHTHAETLHAALSEQRDWLEARGIAYGDAGSKALDHDPLWVACAMDVPAKGKLYGVTNRADQTAFRDALTAKLAEERRALEGQADRMILSAPALTGQMFHPDAIARLKSMLEPVFDEITLVVYVRRQDDAILAGYEATVRTGTFLEPFEAYVRACLSQPSPLPYLTYRRELMKWCEVWGPERIVLRRFSNTDFIGGSLLGDFMGVVQESWQPDLAGLEPVSATPPISAPALEMLRRLQSEARFPQNEEAEAALAALPHLPRPVMPAALSLDIMLHFEVANRWLKETFAPDLDGAFFPDRPDHPHHGNLGQLTVDDAVAVTQAMLGLTGDTG